MTPRETAVLEQTNAASAALDEFDLDVTVVESGPVLDDLIQLTSDGCGHTCESACSNTCP